MTRAQALALTIERCNAAVEHQLEDAEICLRDQGTRGEKLADELAALRELFEAHAHREIAAAARFLASGDGTLH